MTEKLTIALVTTFPPGQKSLNEYGLHLARELVARQDVETVVVLADKINGPSEELDLGSKLEVRRVWTFNSAFAGFAILRELRRLNPEGALFNVQTASFGDREMPAALGLTVPMAARWMGIPCGVIAHNIIAGIDLENTILKGRRLRQAIVRGGGAIVSRAMCAASYITVTLPGYESHLKGRHPRADITHVPHGTFDTGTYDALAFDERPQRIVTMGKFGTYKRLETILAAFEKLRDDSRFKDFELVIGGTDHPNTPGYVAQLAQEWEGDEQVRFSGYVSEEDVPDFFGGARLSVFDYNSTTGSSGVLHQATSFGTVPVFPNIGDFVEVSEDEGLTGFHFEPGSVESMAEAMSEALSDPQRSANMAASNREVALGMPLSEVAEFHVVKLRSLGQDSSCSLGGSAAQPSV